MRATWATRTDARESAREALRLAVLASLTRLTRRSGPSSASTIPSSCNWRMCAYTEAAAASHTCLDTSA